MFFAPNQCEKFLNRTVLINQKITKLKNIFIPLVARLAKSFDN